MPIYHIIGNVTTDANGIVTNVEAINDVSSVILYKGIYHIFHQCCQVSSVYLLRMKILHYLSCVCVRVLFCFVSLS